MIDSHQWLDSCAIQSRSWLWFDTERFAGSLCSLAALRSGAIASHFKHTMKRWSVIHGDLQLILSKIWRWSNRNKTSSFGHHHFVMPTVPFVARLALPLLGVQTRSACLPPVVTNSLLQFLSATRSSCDTTLHPRRCAFVKIVKHIARPANKVRIKQNDFRVCMETLCSSRMP
jgi:hypothetical protein